MTSVYGTSSSASQLVQLYQQLAHKNSVAKNSASAKAFETASSANIAGAIPTQGKADLAALFKDIDTDGDGTVSKEEFSSAFQKLDDKTKTALLSAQSASGQSETVDDLFAQIDSDGNGNVSVSEFDAVAPDGLPPVGGHHHHHHGAQTADSNDALNSLFTALDTDSDGAVSKDELSAALDKLKSTSSTTAISDQSAAAGISNTKNNELSELVSNLYKVLEGKQSASAASTSSVIFA